MSKISGAQDITIEDYLKYPKFHIPFLFQRVCLGKRRN